MNGKRLSCDHCQLYFLPSTKTKCPKCRRWLQYIPTELEIDSMATAIQQARYGKEAERKRLLRLSSKRPTKPMTGKPLSSDQQFHGDNKHHADQPYWGTEFESENQ